MKESSTPLNSPSLTLALVGPRQSSPTFCQSASVGRALADAGNLQDLGAQIILRQREIGERAECAGRAKGGGTCCALEDGAPVRSDEGLLIVLLLFHHETSLC